MPLHAKGTDKPWLPSTSPVLHWENLFPGDRVEVWTDPHKAFKGTVSDRTEDGQIMWIIEHGVGTREMIHREDHPTVYQIL